MSTPDAGRFWPLHASVALLLAATGMQGTLLGVRATGAGFGGVVTGIIMASYYVGFLLGSRATARSLAQTGHLRVFIGLAVLAAITAPAHVAWVSPIPWCLLRLGHGFAMAGAYVVWETWINGRATHDNRGRLLAVYMTVMMTGFAIGPLLINLGDTTRAALFFVPSVLSLASIVPVVVARATAPSRSAAQHLSLRELVRLVPSGSVGAFATGMTNGALIGMGAVYAKGIGLDAAHVSVFIFCCYAGSVLFQLPIGWLYDHLPRRAVLIAVSVGAAALSMTALAAPRRGVIAYILILGIGGLTFPLYGLTLAYINDWVPDATRAAAGAGFVFIGGVGAIIGPVATALAMKGAGNAGYFWAQVVPQLCLAVFLALKVLHEGLPPTFRTGRRAPGVLEHSQL